MRDANAVETSSGVVLFSHSFSLRSLPFLIENVGPGQVQRHWQVRLGPAQQGHPGQHRQGRGQHPDRQRRCTCVLCALLCSPTAQRAQNARPPRDGPAQLLQKFTVSGSRDSGNGNTSAELKGKYYDAANGT